MAEIKKTITNSYKETINEGKKLAKSLKKGSIVGLFGELGSGKTTLIKGIVQAFCPSNEVNSPTFTYLNIYSSKIPIYHFDLYRIKNKNHFFAMGFEEYFTNDGLCLIEWAENIKDILPKDVIIIKIKHLSENKRSIEIFKQI